VESPNDISRQVFFATSSSPLVLTTNKVANYVKVYH